MFVVCLDGGYNGVSTMKTGSSKKNSQLWWAIYQLFCTSQSFDDFTKKGLSIFLIVKIVAFYHEESIILIPFAQMI